MIDQSHEYMTLREELLQAKRYVFERPLVISSLVERNRVIWQHVFEYMQEHGAKPVTIECPVRHEDVKDAVSSCH